MSKSKRNTFDCSKKQDNNPTSLLQDSYQELMAEEDLGQLKLKTSYIIENSSISKRNLIKFQAERDEILDVDEFRLYITNYILAGSGMGTRF